MNHQQDASEHPENGAEKSVESSGHPPEQDPAVGESEVEQPSRSASSWSGRFALLLSLAALGLAGWLFQEQRHDEGLQEATHVRQELASAAAGMDELSERLDAARDERRRLLDQQETLNEQVVALGGQFGDLEQRWSGSFERRLAALEQSLAGQSAQWSDELAALEERLAEAVDAWELRGDDERQLERDLQRQIVMLEAAALLRIGQERAELGADLIGAGQAFRRADQQLARVDDVRLERVRRLLAAELEALESVVVPDLDHALGRLDRLARESRAWPSLAGAVAAPGDQAPAPEGEAQAPWRERLGGAVRSLVTVQARDELGRTFEQFESARELLQMRLVAAQLAVMRSDREALGLQLAAALDLLEEWFDPASDAVARARADLDELTDLRFERELPELGEALNRLQVILGDS